MDFFQRIFRFFFYKITFLFSLSNFLFFLYPFTAVKKAAVNSHGGLSASAYFLTFTGTEMTSPGLAAEFTVDHSFSNAAQSRTGRSLVQTS